MLDNISAALHLELYHSRIEVSNGGIYYSEQYSMYSFLQTPLVQSYRLGTLCR